MHLKCCSWILRLIWCAQHRRAVIGSQACEPIRCCMRTFLFIVAEPRSSQLCRNPLYCSVALGQLEGDLFPHPTFLVILMVYFAPHHIFCGKENSAATISTRKKQLQENKIGSNLQVWVQENRVWFANWSFLASDFPTLHSDITHLSTASTTPDLPVQ